MIVSTYRRRTSAHQITITDGGGNNVVIRAGDAIRVKIGKTGRTPILDLTSDSNTPNGSSVSLANPSTLRLDQDDMTFEAGVYSIEVAVVDSNDSNVIKHAETGSFVLIDTPLGGVT